MSNAQGRTQVARRLCLPRNVIDTTMAEGTRESAPNTHIEVIDDYVPTHHRVTQQGSKWVGLNRQTSYSITQTPRTACFQKGIHENHQTKIVCQAKKTSLVIILKGAYEMSEIRLSDSIRSDRSMDCITAQSIEPGKAKQV